jgi:hypothetical protein
MIMGGFHYFQGSDKANDQYIAVHPLRYEDVIPMLRNKTLSLPTKEELQNQSKSDGLAKTLVLLQTLWTGGGGELDSVCVFRHNGITRLYRCSAQQQESTEVLLG